MADEQHYPVPARVAPSADEAPADDGAAVAAEAPAAEVAAAEVGTAEVATAEVAAAEAPDAEAPTAEAPDPEAPTAEALQRPIPEPTAADAWPWTGPPASNETPLVPPSTPFGARSPRPADRAAQRRSTRSSRQRARAGAGRVRSRRGVAPGVVAVIGVLALLVGAIAGLVLAPWFGVQPAAQSQAPPTAEPAPSTLPAPTSPAVPVAPSDPGAGADIAAIAAQALPSTVYIELIAEDGTGASGSGFVLREDGYILTNAHVVSGFGDDPQVVVVFADGEQSEASIVGITHDYDLAVLHVDRTGLVPLPLGDSDALVVGQPVVAVGAPLGLQGTVTAGIVSALNRPVQAGNIGDSSFINAIQTDAAINPGNSGGPLLDAHGSVIGINSAIAQTSTLSATGSIGLGFAIPSNQARRTAEQLIADGFATYPVIGVMLDSRYVGIGVKVSEEGTVDAPVLTPGGPGELAGIEPGDIIVAIDGTPVTSPDELIVAIRARAPGETVTLTLREPGGDRDIAVVLGESRSQ